MVADHFALGRDDNQVAREQSTGRSFKTHFSLKPGDRPALAERRGFVLRRLTVLGDLLALALTGALSLLALQMLGRPIIRLDILLYLAFIPLWPLVGISMRLYHPHTVGRGLTVTLSDEFAPVFRVSTMWSWFLIVARSVASFDPIQLAPSLLIWAISIPALLIVRSVVRQIARRRGWYRQKVLVVGRFRDAAKVVSRIERHPEWGLTVAKEIDVADDLDRMHRDESLADELDVDDLLERADRLGVSRVIFATPPGQLDARTDLTREFIESGTQVDFVPGEAEILRSGAAISHLEGLPLMSMPGAMPPRSWGALKRLMDLAIAVPALILVSPVIAWAAFRIKRDSEGPAFYRQRRAGLHGRHFDFLKLRTMQVDADRRLAEVAELSIHRNGLDHGIFKAADDPRVTKVGAKLRRRSLDELPQLWNVVRGDMSLVGPRPLPTGEDERVAGHYELRRHVRPGLTGPWQVNGRSDIPFHDMLRLDYSYVLNWSLSTDLKLLVQTVDAVARGRGAY